MFPRQPGTPPEFLQERAQMEVGQSGIRMFKLSRSLNSLSSAAFTQSSMKSLPATAAMSDSIEQPLIKGVYLLLFVCQGTLVLARW